MPPKPPSLFRPLPNQRRIDPHGLTARKLGLAIVESAKLLGFEVLNITPDWNAKKDFTFNLGGGADLPVVVTRLVHEEPALSSYYKLRGSTLILAAVATFIAAAVMIAWHYPIYVALGIILIFASGFMAAEGSIEATNGVCELDVGVLILSGRTRIASVRHNADDPLEDVDIWLATGSACSLGWPRHPYGRILSAEDSKIARQLFETVIAKLDLGRG